MSDENSTGNGAEPRKARVKYGDKPWQTMPHERAELLLIRLRGRDPKRFGDALRDVMMADE
jgi:hypothetical protein